MYDIHLSPIAILTKVLTYITEITFYSKSTTFICLKISPSYLKKHIFFYLPIFLNYKSCLFSDLNDLDFIDINNQQ